MRKLFVPDCSFCTAMEFDGGTEGKLKICGTPLIDGTAPVAAYIKPLGV